MALIQEVTVFTAGQWQAHWKVYLREFLLWQFLWKAWRMELFKGNGCFCCGSGIRIFYEKAVYRYTQCKYSEDKAGKSFLGKYESSPARLAALF